MGVCARGDNPRMVVSFALAIALSASPSSAILGAWRGPSHCLVKSSPCHDEENVYHFSSADEADHLRVTGNKIVDGKEVGMGGDLDCRYDARKSAIDCPMPRGGTLHLDVNGDAME